MVVERLKFGRSAVAHTKAIPPAVHVGNCERERTAVEHIVVGVAREVGVFSEVVVVECGSHGFASHKHLGLASCSLAVAALHGEAVAIGVGRSHIESGFGRNHLVHLVAPFVGVRSLTTCH